MFLTCLHTRVVVELVPAGTLTLELSRGQSGGGDSVRTYAAMPVARLGQAEQCTRLICACVMTYSKRTQHTADTIEIRTAQTSFSPIYKYSYIFDIKSVALLLYWPTSGFALIEDFKVHDPSQPADEKLAVRRA